MSKSKKNMTEPGQDTHRRYAMKLDEICNEESSVDSGILRSVIELAVELAREGREGRKIGTILIVGDHEAVLRSSRPLILDPLRGHPASEKKIQDRNMRETIKELAQLDGAFVVSGNGIVISACRYINADSRNIDLPLGLGSRHVAAASISRDTNAAAVVVSESSVVRVLSGGKIVAEIIPELWLIRRAGSINGRQN